VHDINNRKLSSLEIDNKYINDLCTDEIVKFLINVGANLCLTDSEGLTAAYHALAFDHINVVKSLPLSALYTENLIFLELSKNENENLQNLQKKEDFSNDLKVDLNVNIRSAFHIVCQWGSVKSLEYLLKLNNLELNIIKKNNFFMNNNNNDKNELKIILNNHMDIVDDIVLEKYASDYLIEKNILFKINCFLADGTTPIHLVARYNHSNCLELLLNNNADYNCKDYNNDTPLDIANRWGRQAIVDYLSKYFEK
jgi:ankyrin repeat protein